MIIFKSYQALEHIKPFLPDNPVIVEAGAFAGYDTVKMANLWPKGTLHAFEPVPELFDTLCKKTAPYNTIHCYPLALSDVTGTASFYIAEKEHKPGVPTQAGSLRKPKKRLEYSPIKFPRTITVKTVTLDDWAEKNKIDHIDLLWLDMQGHELSALQGGTALLKKVKAIHTEVGFIEGYKDQPHYDQVKKWLKNHGFDEIGRDFENQENWFFGNALFAARSFKP